MYYVTIFACIVNCTGSVTNQYDISEGEWLYGLEPVWHNIPLPALPSTILCDIKLATKFAHFLKHFAHFHEFIYSHATKFADQA